MKNKLKDQDVKQILKYTALERIRVKKPTTRIDYLKGKCINKSVCDIGALDETAYLLKSGSVNWLHGQIAEVAKCVVGLDNSEMLPPPPRKNADR